MITDDPRSIPKIPKETVQAARATFGRGNFYILIGNHLEGILGEIQRQPAIETSSAQRGENVILPLITLFQFMEGLTDGQAIEAMRTRTDWKFALHLSLFPGRLNEDELCRFRQRVFHSPASQQRFQMLLERLRTVAPALQHNFQTLKSLEVVCVVCCFNRLHQAQQTMNQALEVLAVRFPEWLRKIALPHWYGRYNPVVPRLDVAIMHGQQTLFMEEIASDILYLLEKIHQSGLREIGELYEVQALGQLECQPLCGSHRDTLSSKNCDICSRKGAGRRHPA